MHIPNYEVLVEQSALKLYESFQELGDIFLFLQHKLPQKYGLAKGYLINNKKAVSNENIAFFNQLTCPVLPLTTDQTPILIPVNFTYGNLLFFDTINQHTLEKGLAQKKDFTQIFMQHKEAVPAISPLNIWFANDLAPFISINDLEDRLLAETTPPDLVVILNRGLLAILNEQSIQTIFALQQKTPSQSFDKAILENLVPITQKTLTTKYFKMASSAPYKNCYCFYIILLELLKNQPLLDEGLSAEMVSIW